MGSCALQNIPAKAFVVELAYDSVKKKSSEASILQKCLYLCFITRKNTGNSESKNNYKFHYFITMLKLENIQWNKV